MVGEFREEDAPRSLLRGAGPARQAQQRAPNSFVDDAVADEVVILAVIEQRYADPYAYSTARRISSLFCTQRPSSVIADHTRLGERTDRRPFSPARFFEIAPVGET